LRLERVRSFEIRERVKENLFIIFLNIFSIFKIEKFKKVMVFILELF